MTTLRHRALPVGEDLPEPLRDSEATGKPGYKGRKRGDSRETRERIEHPHSATLVWLDGEHGNVPWLRLRLEVWVGVSGGQAAGRSSAGGARAAPSRLRLAQEVSPVEPMRSRLRRGEAR